MRLLYFLFALAFQYLVKKIIPKAIPTETAKIMAKTVYLVPSKSLRGIFPALIENNPTMTCIQSTRIEIVVSQRIALSLSPLA